MVKFETGPSNKHSSVSLPDNTAAVDNDFDDLSSFSGPGYARFAKAQIVLTGGGLSPDEELRTLHRCSLELQASLESPEREGRRPGEILYVTWASKSDHDQALKEFCDDVQRVGLAGSLSVTLAPSYPAMLGAEPTDNWKGEIFRELSEWEKKLVRKYDRFLQDVKAGAKIDSSVEQVIRNSIDFRSEFLRQLNGAGILYGSSGNQERMIELASLCDVKDKIVRKILDGELLYAGTSAGAAVAPGMMITPNGLKPGLGILPEHIAVDQHIDAEGRNRVLRLMDSMLENPLFTVGIGIYEGTSVRIHGPVLSVIGGTNVMYIRKVGDDLVCKKISTGDSVLLYDENSADG
jgi:hypothetical protein